MIEVKVQYKFDHEKNWLWIPNLIDLVDQIAKRLFHYVIGPLE